MASYCERNENNLLSNLKDTIEYAKDLLIHKKFIECIQICQSVVYQGRKIGFVTNGSTLLNQEDQNSENQNKNDDPITVSRVRDRISEITEMPNASEDTICKSKPEIVKDNLEYSVDVKLKSIIDTAVILSIQAFAELNQWNEVIPYVRKIYGEIENCPAQVIKICLLLHAKVKEFIQCHALAKIWTHCEANYELSNYKDVVELYTCQILAPHNYDYQHISKVIDSCGGLSSNDKEHLCCKLRHSRKVCSKSEHPLLTSPESSSELRHQPNCDNESESEVSPLDFEGSWEESVIEYGSSLLRTWYQNLTQDKLKKLWKIMLMVALTLFAFLQTQYGDFTTNLNRAMVVWQGVLKVFKSMFGFDHQ